MAELTGVMETALYVADMDRSVAFYSELFGFDVLVSDRRLTALRVCPGQVVLLFAKGGSTEPITGPGGVIPPHDGSGNLHMAFSIPASALADWERRLVDRAIDIESRVMWPRGGTSLYFRDPDDHVIELATPGVWPNY